MGDIVILSDNEEADPRTGDDADRIGVRIVLHQRTSSIIVEVRDGVDGVGEPAWLRLDPGSPRASPADIRAAYGRVEKILTGYYARAISAEERVTKAEARTVSEFRRPLRTPLLTPDPREASRRRMAQLAELVLRGQVTDEESRTAAVALVKILHEQGMLPKIDTRPPANSG